MKSLKFIYDILSWGVFFVIILIAVFTIASNTSLLGGYRSYLVQSGSMEPTIMTGDIVIVHDNGRYFDKDVITFLEKESRRVVTHRIVKSIEENGTTVFETKGDANRSLDQDTVPLEDVIGRVIFTVPKLGYLVAFAKSPFGLVIFIIIPSILLISQEVLGIIKKPKRGE